MKLSFVLILLMMSVMPSSAEKSLTTGGYLDSYARYRPTRHHHGGSFRARRIGGPHIYEPDRNVLPTTTVAETNLGPFDGKDYAPIRWTDVDVSTVLRPHDYINFPPDPGKFRLPADPPNIKRLWPTPEQHRAFEEKDKKYFLYSFALLLMAILATGSAREIGMLKTCHKRRQEWLSSNLKRDPLAIVKLRHFKNDLHNLT